MAFMPGWYAGDTVCVPIETLMLCAEDAETEEEMIDNLTMLNAVMEANVAINRMMNVED